MAEKLEYTEIIVEKKPPIGYITINRPEKRNTINMAPGRTGQQLDQAYVEMADDPEIRVFILKGAGENFSAGFDLGTGEWTGVAVENPLVKGREREAWVRLVGPRDNPEGGLYRRSGLWWDGLWNNPTPSIALVRGYCLGAGLMTANLCDIVYATPTAVFAYPPIRFGSPVTPTILPAWILGLRKTMEMALTGKYITADEAYNCGLITKIVPDDKLEEEGRKAAESIAKVPPLTNYFSKRAVHSYFEGLGIHEWHSYAGALCLLFEQASTPGGNIWFSDLIKEKGFTEANRILLENYGYPDEVRERERTRQKALRAKKGGS